MSYSTHEYCVYGQGLMVNQPQSFLRDLGCIGYEFSWPLLVDSPSMHTATIPAGWEGGKW